VKALDGSEQAKRRLGVVLQTLTGGCSVKEACEELGISEARFHVIRRESLQGALEELEPRPVGRPTQGQPDEHTAILEERVAELETELRRTQARADVAEGRLHFALCKAPKGGGRRGPRREDREGGGTKRRR
jgi:transposase-like protein